MNFIEEEEQNLDNNGKEQRREMDQIDEERDEDEKRIEIEQYLSQNQQQNNIRVKDILANTPPQHTLDQYYNVHLDVDNQIDLLDSHFHQKYIQNNNTTNNHNNTNIQHNITNQNNNYYNQNIYTLQQINEEKEAENHQQEHIKQQLQQNNEQDNNYQIEEDNKLQIDQVIKQKVEEDNYQLENNQQNIENNNQNAEQDDQKMQDRERRLDYRLEDLDSREEQRGMEIEKMMSMNDEDPQKDPFQLKQRFEDFLQDSNEKEQQKPLQKKSQQQQQMQKNYTQEDHVSSYKPGARTSNVSILRQLSSNCSFLNRKDKTNHFKKASLDQTKNNAAIKANINHTTNNTAKTNKTHNNKGLPVKAFHQLNTTSTKQSTTTNNNNNNNNNKTNIKKTGQYKKSASVTYNSSSFRQQQQITALQRKQQLMRQQSELQNSQWEDPFKYDLETFNIYNKSPQDIINIYSLKKNTFKSNTNNNNKSTHIYDDVDLQANFTLGSQLGKGSYATVKNCYLKQQQDFPLAIKTYEKFRLKEPSKMRNLIKEVNILRECEHINIMKLYYCIEDNRQIHLVSENIQGDLTSYLRRHEGRRLGELEAQGVFRQMAQAIHYLHNKDIVHRDIKLDNILYDASRRVVKLIDFGFSHKLSVGEEKVETYCGTPQYMCPQIIKQRPLDPKKADVWALGIVLFNLTQGRDPFKALTEKSLCKLILSAAYVLEPHTSNNLTHLFSQIFQLDETNRISAAQILAHPWLQ